MWPRSPIERRLDEIFRSTDDGAAAAQAATLLDYR